MVNYEKKKIFLQITRYPEFRIIQKFLPLYRFGTASIFEYLEARFSRWVRWLASFEFTVHYIMYNGMIIYLPALALETVTGLNRWAAVWMICKG